MHFYSYDVPRFVQKHKTLGLLSEEEGESLYNAFNMENRQLLSVKNASERIKFIRMHLSLRRHAIRSHSDKSLLKACPGLCKCSAQGLLDKSKRTFLKSGETECAECRTIQAEKVKSSS